LRGIKLSQRDLYTWWVIHELYVCVTMKVQGRMRKSMTASAGPPWSLSVSGNKPRKINSGRSFWLTLIAPPWLLVVSHSSECDVRTFDVVDPSHECPSPEGHLAPALAPGSKKSENCERHVIGHPE
jgi:hypothetical protein